MTPAALDRALAAHVTRLYLASQVGRESDPEYAAAPVPVAAKGDRNAK